MYRVHEKPDPQRLEDFNTLIAPFGLSLPADALLKGLPRAACGRAGHAGGKAGFGMLLRSMKKGAL